MISKSQLQQNESTLDNVVEHICSQLEDGQSVDLEQLLEQFPDWADRLRVIFPTLLAMADWHSSDSQTNPQDTAVAGFENREIGDFRIIRQIGRGGMGVVYEAQQQSIARRVALKILPLAALVDHRALQRFKNEITAIATLEHPHIVSVYSVGEERGIHYFAMQLIHGQSLAAVIRELAARAEQEGSGTGVSLNQVVSDLEDGSQEKKSSENTGASESETPVDELTETAAIETIAKGRSNTAPSQISDETYFRNVVRLTLQAAEALQHAHDHGIVHRDVKPGNLLLDKHGSLFVTDFGLARIETGVGITMTGEVLGTLRYMSPEQVLANRVVIDHRTDVYSLGATLYEMLALQPMWSGRGKAELIRQISFEEPVAPKKINLAIPVDLETIVLKAIAKNPSDRYDSAAALGEDLQRFLDYKTILARRPSISQRWSKWMVRHKAIVAIGLVALVLIAATSTVGALLVWNESQQRISAVVAREFALQKAKTASDRAEKIHDFVLLRMMMAASGNDKESRDITVRTALLSIVEDVDKEFAGQPTMKAYVQDNLGQYLFEIGEFEKARKNMEAALKTFRTVDDMESTVLETLLDLIPIYYETGEHELAVSTAHEAIASSTALHGEIDSKTLDAMWHLGHALTKKEQFADAEKILKEVVSLARQTGNTGTESVAINALGIVCYHQQRYDEAESYWNTALEMATENDEGFNIVVYTQNLSNVYWETDRQSESLALSKQVVDRMVEMLGPTHPRSLTVLENLAGRRWDTNPSPDEADFRTLFERTREKHGATHPETARVMAKLGGVLRELGEFDKALQLQQSALKIEKKKFGDDHPRVLSTLGRIALTYAATDDSESAAEYYRQVIESRKKIAAQEPNDWRNAVSLGGTYCNLGNLLKYKLKKFDEALTCYSNAIEVLEQINQTSPTVQGKSFLVNSYQGRAETYASLKQWSEALADAEKSEEMATTPSRRDDMLLAKARILALRGDYKIADELVGEVESRIDDAGKYYWGSCVLALCAIAARNDDSADESKQKASFEDYATRSIEWLRMAHEQNYFRNANRIDDFREEPHFDAIRHRADFEELSTQILTTTHQKTQGK